MKPLPLALLVLAAAVASWWLFRSDDVQEPDSGVGTADATDATGGERDVQPPRPVPLPAAPAKATPTPAKAALPETAAKPKKKWIVPLSDKFLEKASWADEEALIVVQHVAQAAGKGLKLSNTARRRLAKARVTLDLGRTPVSRLLDLVTKPHTLGWNLKAGAIHIFDDDD